MSEDTFATRLQRALRRSGLETQRALAEESGIDVTYLSRLWTGKVERPTYEIVYKLATALRCSVTDLAPWFEVTDVPRQPVPAVFDAAVPDDALPPDDEVIAAVEAIDDARFQAQMAELRIKVSSATYLFLCQQIFRSQKDLRAAILNTFRTARAG